MSDKCTKEEHLTRLRVVQEWILEEHKYSDIVRSCMSKWGVSKRQSERYYKDAYKAFSEGEVKNVEQKKAYYIQRKKKLIREMNAAEKKTAAGVTAINRVLDSMAEMEGIKVNKHEITGKDGEAIGIPSIVVYNHAPPLAGSEDEITE